MNKFKKWDRIRMEDWGSSMSTEAKSFYREFKNYLKREFPDAVFTGFKPNHYDFSGFISMDGLTIYVSHSLKRVCGGAFVDFNDSYCPNGVLYRTAKNTKDFRGGRNNFCSIYGLSDALKQMFNTYRGQAAA